MIALGGSRRLSTAVLGVALASFTHLDVHAASHSAAPPNIVWLVAEDLSPIIPPFGDHTVTTPNLTRLASEGIRYSNVFSVSGVCAPSRFSLATGVYTTSAGAQHMRVGGTSGHLEALGLQPYEVVPAPQVRMLSEVLRRHGYYATNNEKRDHQFAAPVTAWDEIGARAHWRGRPAGAPFFSVFNFVITHESQVWAETPRLWLFRYQELFRQNPDPRYFDRTALGRAGSFPDNLAASHPVAVPPYLPDTERVRNDLRRVYSNVIELDRMVGNVLDALEEDALLDDTIVVFYSDHGGPLPRQKRLLYDSGLRVPMIIRFPPGMAAGDARSGSLDERLISFVDFAPTTLSLAGVRPPDYIEGRAFLGASAAAPRVYVHAAADRLDEHYDTIRAVRDRRFKYLRNYRPEQGYYLPVAYRERMASMQELLRLRDEGQLTEAQAQWFRPSKPTEELFDTHSDPHELRNLAADRRFQPKLEELRGELERWLTATGDKGFIGEAELIDSFWPGGTQPQTSPVVARQTERGVELSSSTPGASIGYQLIDAEQNPGTRWQVYRQPVDVPAGQTLAAVAHRLGYRQSGMVRIEPHAR